MTARYTHQTHPETCTPIEEDTAAALFTLENQDSETVALTQLKGRMVFAYSYPKGNTPGCTSEACGFHDLWGELADPGHEVMERGGA